MKVWENNINYVEVQRAVELEMKVILAAKLADDEVVEMWV